MARKYTFELLLRDDAGNTFGGQFVFDTEDGSTDEDSAREAFLEYLAEYLSVEAVTQSYSVTVCLKQTFSFTYEDEDGDWADESEVQQAIENGDISIADFVSLSDPDDEEVEYVEVELY